MKAAAEVSLVPTSTPAVRTEKRPPQGAAALPDRFPALDGVRGIAILLVIVHMMGMLDAPHGAAGVALSFLLVRGWIGVQLFFVLSGFLITGILLDTQSADNALSAFFARRLLRIFPLYYFTLIVAFVVLPALGPLPPTLAHDRAHQIWFWTYLSNWTAPYEAGGHAFPHFWSLAVEEQFYLVWPFVLRRRTPASCLKFCLGVAAVSFLARVAFLVARMPDTIYWFSITRMDALALGAAAAAALRIPSFARRFFAGRQRLWLASLATGVAGALVTKGYSLMNVLGESVGYTFLSVTLAFAVLAAATADAAPVTRLFWLRARPLRGLGKYSYGMYVFQKPLHDFVGRPLLSRFGIDMSHSAWITSAYVACGTAVAFAAAFVSYHLFEIHFLRLKAFFVPRSKPTADCSVATGGGRKG